MPTKRKTAPGLDAYIRAELFDGGSVCPVCAAGSVIAGTVAGDDYGVCMACYNKALFRAVKSRARDVESNKDYQSARKAASSAGFPVSSVDVTGDDVRGGDELTDWQLNRPDKERP